MAITDFFPPELQNTTQKPIVDPRVGDDYTEVFRVTTEYLTAVFTETFARIKIYSVNARKHGWTERKMVYTSYGVPLEEFSTEFVKLEVSNVYKDFDQQEIDLLMKKAIVKLIQNEK